MTQVGPPSTGLRTQLAGARRGSWHRAHFDAHRGVEHTPANLSRHAHSPFAMPAQVAAGTPPELQRVAQTVPVHDDEFAHKMAADLQVRAFTAGGNVYFGAGSWQPTTPSGRALLRHELRHVARKEGNADSIEGWSTSGHRTITTRALANDPRYSAAAKRLLANTAPVPDYNRPQILQDMVSFWAGESLWRAPLGFLGGGIIGALTPPSQGTEVGGARLSGALPQAILGTGVIPTVPEGERARGGAPRPELSRTRVTQELANHGEDLPARNEARQNEFVDHGVSDANACDLYDGLVQLGYALHVAQDRGSHGDGYTAEYVRGRPHHEIDSISENAAGVAAAIANSVAAVNRFHENLSARKRQALADPLTLLLTRPPVAETLLAPEPTGRPTPGHPPEEPAPGTFNVLTVRF